MKILIIRYKKSTNVLEGGEQASQRNLNILTTIVGQDNVLTYYIHDETKKKSIIDYLFGGACFLKNYHFGLTPKRLAQIVKLAQEYDVVFIDRSIFGIIAKILKDKQYKGQIICFFHNVEVSYFEAKMSKYRLLSSIILRCVDNNDRYCCEYADKVIALNQRDECEIFARYGRHADMLIPITFQDKYIQAFYPQDVTRKRPLCVFLGSYFPPNCEGIDWFMKNVYPYVQIEVKIVGKGMNKLREHYNIPKDVSVESDVPDLCPYFEEADLMVFPIFSGSGMKVKTCESLMYGKNIIGTDEAFEGYELDFEKIGGKCNTAEEFISVINSFINNPKPRFNLYARQTFLEKYTEEVVVNRFSNILSRE